MPFGLWRKKYIVSRNQRSSIEPEEIFFDAQIKQDRISGELTSSKLEVPISFNNFKWIGFLIAIVSLVMFSYDFYLQYMQGSVFALQAKNNNMRIQSIKAPRGIIYDRNMTALVTNEPSFDVVAVPKDLPSDQDGLENEIKNLSDIIGISENELKVVIESADKMSILPVMLKENLDKNLALLLETQIGNFKGIKVEKNAVRDYKNSLAFSHVIGYVAKISTNELKDKIGYMPTDYIGKMGVEQSYEHVLKGKNGKYVIYLDAKHNILKEGMEQGSSVGDSVVLSIDADLQNKVFELLEDARKETGLGASFVAINPQNGKILAMASSPGFDNNLFSHGITSKDYQFLLNDKTKPLFNRVVSGKYPPGSSIKPYIGLAALEEKIITPEREILSTGSVVIGSNPETAFVFRDWKEGGHGLVNIVKAIAQSVNTYFYAVGGGHQGVEGLGIDRMKKYLELFGFNNQLGIDIIGETSGFLPTPEWKKERLNERWYIGDDYNAAIGQGYILVTPLQIAGAVSVIANEGILYQPQLVDKIVNSDKELIKEIEPKVIKKDFAQDKNLNVIKMGMRETIISGSARSLGELPIKVAGKTGTAQFGSDGKTHAWFSGFGPYDDPEIALAVLVEGGGEGSSVAVPIAREVFRWWADAHTQQLTNGE